jgi:hypothetical protein
MTTPTGSAPAAKIEPELKNEVISARTTIKTERISCQIVFIRFIAAIAPGSLFQPRQAPLLRIL